MSLEPWELIDSKSVVKTNWVDLQERHYRLPNGKGERTFHILKEGSGVVIVPRTADGSYVLVRQYRPAIDAIVYDFPAGAVEEGESPLATGKRELEEETGYVGGDWHEVGTHTPWPPRADKVDYAVLALNVQHDGAKHFDENEEIECEVVSAARLQEMIKSSEFRCAGCLAALYKAEQKEKELGLRAEQ